MISTCPDETTLAAFVDGGLAPSAHEAVVTHVSDCARCAELLSVEARASVQGTPQALDPALLARARAAGAGARQPRSGRVRSWMPLGAAAAAVLVAAVLWRPAPVGGPGTATEEGERAQPTVVQPPVSARQRRALQADAVSAPAITTPVEGATQPASPFELSWTPVAQSLGYDVQLLTEAGEIAWQTHADANRATVAADALRPGRTYYLRVAARLPDGRRVPSPAVAFHVADPR